MLPILTDVVGIPLAEAVRMASLTPARVIGLADRKGSLAPGKDADVAIFNPDFSAWGTLVRGRWVHGPGETAQAGDGSARATDDTDFTEYKFHRIEKRP